MMKRRIGLCFFLALALSSAALGAETLDVLGLGTIEYTKSGSAYTVDLGRVGTYTFTGSTSPLSLQASVTIDQLKEAPGYRVIRHMGFREAALKISAEGLDLFARADTKAQLSTLCKFFQADAPFVELRARITTKGIALRGDLLFSKKGFPIEIVPVVGTRFIFDTVTLKLDAAYDEAGGLEGALPIIEVIADLRVKPSKWDPELKSNFTFRYNLATQLLEASGAMLDTWTNPFNMGKLFGGRTIISLKNVAVEIGWIPGMPTPTKIGFYVEDATILGISMGAAMDLNPVDGKVAFMGRLDKLSAGDLVRVIGTAFGKTVPALIPDGLAYRDVYILFSPDGGKVGPFTIESGLALRGEVDFGDAVKARLDFKANWDSGIYLRIALDAAIKELVARELRTYPALVRQCADAVLDTFEFRKAALEAKVSGSALGAVLECAFRLLGKDYALSLGGYLDPKALARAIAKKAGETIEAFVAEVGRAIDRAADLALDAASAAYAEAKKIAADVGASLSHAGHSKERCDRECVPAYADGPRARLLEKDDAAVAAFVASALPWARTIAGGSPAETRSLREAALRASWDALTRGIDADWKKLFDDDFVKNFYFLDSSEENGFRIYRDLIRESWEAHKAHRAAAYERILASKPLLRITRTAKEALDALAGYAKDRVPLVIEAKAENIAWELPLASGGGNGTPIIFADATGSAAQQWLLVPAGEAGWYFIKNLANGRFLHIKDALDARGSRIVAWDGAVPPQAKFRASADDRGFLRLATAKGLAFDLAGGDARAGAALQVWDATGGDNQAFYFYPAKSPVDTARYYPEAVARPAADPKAALAALADYAARGVAVLIEGRTHAIAWSATSLPARAATNGSPVAFALTTGADLQRWVLVPAAEKGKYHIKNVQSGLYLHVAGDRLEAGAGLCLWDGYSTKLRGSIFSAAADKDGFIGFAADNGLVLELEGGVFEAGRALKLGEARGGTGQSFSVRPAPELAKEPLKRLEMRTTPFTEFKAAEFGGIILDDPALKPEDPVLKPKDPVIKPGTIKPISP